MDGSDENEVGAGRTRGIGTGRDQSGRGSVRAGGLQREAGRSGPPVMRDRDADAAGARVEGGVQCLARLGPSCGEACAANESVSSAATTMAACSEVPQPVTTTGSPAAAASTTASRSRVTSGQSAPRDPAP